MSNVFTSSPKSVSGTASLIPRLRGASGGDREGLLQPRTNGIRPSASYGGVGMGMGMGMGVGAGGTTTLANGPGSFSTSLRSVTTAVLTPSNLAGADDISSPTSPLSSERLVEELTDQLNRAIKYKEGAENLLQVLDSKKVKEAKQARNQAEKEYNARNVEITQLKTQIEAITKPKDIPRRRGEGNKFQGTPIRPSEANGLAIMGAPEWGPGSESPMVTLEELLRGLESKGKRPEYYVDKANNLVMLFKRHPNLKYELSWATFGLRAQFMLLHEAKEVVAAGYRITRYAITDIHSLKNIRSLRTDYITIG
jgi:rapamycin-insensitive companion of mTOR